ncbi:MAG: M3 family metallopeptidase [Bacteroidales bacterium]
MKNLFNVAFLMLFVTSSCTTRINPLLNEWDTPFGIPPFEQIELADFKPAYLEGIKEQKKEISLIIENPEEPNFENTIVAYDRSGALLRRIIPVFSSLNSVYANPSVLALSKELSPILNNHYNEIRLNDPLFLRIEEVYNKREDLSLNEEQMRLLSEMYNSFIRNGAKLEPQKKEELKKINTEIAALQLEFGQNLLIETDAFKLVIDNEEDLAGLSQSFIDGAKKDESHSTHPGKWIFGLENPSIIPFLQQSERRELREKMLNEYLNRCNHDNEHDNKEVVKRLVTLRLQRANLLGYSNFAEYQLEERMAKNSEAVYSLLNQLWKPALRSAKAELEDMKLIAAKDGISDFGAHDWRYYFEKAKSAKYELNESQLSPYFKLENVRDGIFLLSNKLYGISFTQLEDVPLPHPDATAFECRDEDGSTLGLLFMDMFARPGEKRGGAWCTRYRTQSYEGEQRVIPLVAIVGNFTPPVDGKPALLSTDEVETFFHEFGHALASLFLDVHYYGVSSLTRDFVELPSQIMEHWAFEPQLLKEYAFHYESGEVIPLELIEKLERSGKYGQGFITTEYLAASFLDMDYHIVEEIPQNFEVESFEAASMAKLGLIEQIPPRYRSTYFNHTFGGGYTAGYYSYIWAEVLDSDAYQAFVETGNIFNRQVATKFRKEILEKGGIDEAMTLYLNFRGKQPSIDALLSNRGLN